VVGSIPIVPIMTVLNKFIRKKREYIEKFGKKPKFFVIGNDVQRELRDRSMDRVDRQLFGLKVKAIRSLNGVYCCDEDYVIYRYP